MSAAPRVVYDQGETLVTEFDPAEPRVIRIRDTAWRYYGLLGLGIETTPSGAWFRLVYRYLDPRLN